jgi:hypothetical protein
MSLLLFDGFEGVGGSQRWGNSLSYSTTVRPATGVRSVNTSVSTSALITTSHDVLVVGFAFRPDTGNATLTNSFMGITNLAGNRLVQFRMRALTTDNTSMAVNVNGVDQFLCCSFSTLIWSYVEIKLTWSTGTVEVRQNGLVVGSMSGIVWAGATTAIDRLAFANITTVQGHWLDDLYVLDGSGAEFNDYLGDVRILPLVTLADGAIEQWVPDTGTNSQARISTINSGSTGFSAGYIQTSTIGHRSTFTLATITAPTSFVPQAVDVNSAILDTAGGNPPKVDGTVRIGGVNYDSGVPAVPNINGFRQEWFFLKNPATGLPWTLAQIQAAEIGLVATS